MNKHWPSTFANVKRKRYTCKRWICIFTTEEWKVHISYTVREKIFSETFSAMVLFCLRSYSPGLTIFSYCKWELFYRQQFGTMFSVPPTFIFTRTSGLLTLQMRNVFRRNLRTIVPVPPLFIWIQKFKIVYTVNGRFLSNKFLENSV